MMAVSLDTESSTILERVIKEKGLQVYFLKKEFIFETGFDWLLLGVLIFIYYMGN